MQRINLRHTTQFFKKNDILSYAIGVVHGFSAMASPTAGLFK
jgi:hypothetical protein